MPNGNHDYQHGEKIGKILGHVESLNNKVETLHQDLKDHIKEEMNGIEGNSDRITRLEKWIWTAGGVIIAVQFMLQVAIKRL